MLCGSGQCPHLLLFAANASVEQFAAVIIVLFSSAVAVAGSTAPDAIVLLEGE